MQRLLAILLLTATTAFGQDVLTIGSDRTSIGGTVQLPVTITAGSGNPIHGVAFKVLFPPESVASLSFTRGGALATRTPLHERTLQGLGWIAYIASFEQAFSGQIGTLNVTLHSSSSSAVTLRLDPPSAMLSNLAGTVRQTVATGELSLINGDISIAALFAPTGLVATAWGTSSVTVTWNAVTGADGYEVWRSSNNNGWVFLDLAGGPAFGDTNVAANTTYLYRVRAVDGAETAGFSNLDAATTIVFSEDTIVRAAHITQLRTAINAMRAAGGLTAMPADATIGVGQVVRATHITAMRTALDEARAVLGLPALSYTDATLMTIRTVHVTELRMGVR
jgi:hypothetical protein